MNLARRSGAPSAFTWLLGLALGVSCAAMTACSAASGSQTVGWNQSGGGPLGGGGSNGASGDDGTGSGATSSSGGSASASSSGSGSPGAGSSGAPTPTPVADAAPEGSGGMTGTGGDAGVEAGPAAAPSLTLIDTTVTTLVDGLPVSGFDPLAEGATVNIAVTGPALSVRANTLPALVGSVAFALDATYTHTENAVPYTLCGDDGTGTITSCASVLTVGKHTLSATPYSGANLTGTAGAAIIVDFTITDVQDAGAGG